MKVEFNLSKSVDENAGRYFDLSKKAKRKLEGAKKALQDSKDKLKALLSQEDKFWKEYDKKQEKSNRKIEWYEKFHWFFSSQDFLCIGGRDATSNEIVIKKHTDPNDLVFHTDMAGSPFFVIKDGQKAGQETLDETAQAVACYSKAWKLGHATADVFWVKPEQVTKKAQSGENLGKGSFMAYGKTTYIHPKLEFAIGLVEDQIIGGPVESVKSKTKDFIIVISGREKKSATAKRIKSLLKGGDLDDVIKFLPSGGATLKKIRKR
jgi:predicted ribosome quality control (RQC) complex YloA/Tae2 family protein